MKSNKFHKFFLLCGIVAPPFLIIFILAANIVTPNYDFISETVSQLGAHGRPYPLIINTGFITFGLLILGFAFGTYLVFTPNKDLRIFLYMCIVYGAGIILTGVFRDDVAGSTGSTIEGFMHSLFAQVAFFALIIGIWFFARGTYHNQSWNKYAKFSIGIAIFNLLSSVIFIFEFSEPVEGLLQRLFYMATLIWIETISIRALRIIKHIPAIN